MSRFVNVGGRQANPPAYLRGEASRSVWTEVIGWLPGKASKLQLNGTVPQTDTGGRAEYAQALERTQEKELGKLTP